MADVQSKRRRRKRAIGAETLETIYQHTRSSPAEPTQTHRQQAERTHDKGEANKIKGGGGVQYPSDPVQQLKRRLLRTSTMSRRLSPSSILPSDAVRSIIRCAANARVAADLYLLAQEKIRYRRLCAQLLDALHGQTLRPRRPAPP